MGLASGWVAVVVVVVVELEAIFTKFNIAQPRHARTLHRGRHVCAHMAA